MDLRRVRWVVALLVALLGASSPSDPRSAEKFNVPGQHRTRTCAEMASPVVALRFPDGSPTGFYARADDPSKQGGEKPCPVGCMETDAHEVLTSGSGLKLYMHPGGGSSHYRDPVENGQYGHVAANDLKTPPKLDPVELNGKPCGPEGENYLITPTRIPLDMYYKPNVERGSSGSTYYTYGNPGYDKTGGRGDWTYINWSWVQNGGSEYPANICHGGGMVRALGKRGALFLAGAVDPVIGYSYGRDNKINGRVTAFYGNTTGGQGGSDIYGWMPHSYQKTGDIIVPCVRRTASGAAKETAANGKANDRAERMALDLLSERAADPARLTALSKSFTAERDPQARMELLTEMAQMDGPESVARMLQLLGREEDPAVREQIIALLGFMRAAAADMKSVCVGLRDNYVKHADERGRLRTLDVVSNIPAPDSVALLRDLNKLSAGDENLSFAFADAAFKLDAQGQTDEKLLGEVISGLQKRVRTAGGDPKVRMRAVTMLAAPFRRQRAFLVELQKEEKWPEVRAFVTKVLATPEPDGK